jgi:hypothetical protein
LSAGYSFSALPGTFAVCRLPATEPLPAWADGAPFSSITRTGDELSIVVPEDRVPAGVQAEGGWAVLRLNGPFPFTAVGVLASVAEPLAAARISLFAVSTFDTDYVLVKESARAKAVAVLLEAGHTLA